MSPYIVTVTRPCICTEADDPNDHRKDCPHWYGADGVSRRAVATLDEAQTFAYDACNIAGDEADAYKDQACDLAESGGTVGPLPDGTVIEVVPIGWRA